MSLRQDVRFALRQLWRRPAFSAAAVLTLAIGIGVNAVAFTVVTGVLFNASPVRDLPGMGRLVITPGGDEGGNGSWPDFERFAEATRGSLDLAAEGRSTVAWRHDGAAETAWVLFVSSNYFSVVPSTPIAGRVAVEGAKGSAPPSAVIGERFWREKLGSRSIAGLTLRFNDADVMVAGVLPESFQGPAGLYSPDVWLALEDSALVGASPRLQARDARWLFFLGRLRPGSTVGDVQGQLETAVATMARDWPESHRDRGARFRLLADGDSELRGLATAAAIAMGIIGLVLLLACFNVASLLLAGAVEREREMGIRTALGAAPARLLRLVLVEGLVMAAAAGTLALVLAWWTQSLVGAFAIPIDVPQHVNLKPDAGVVGFVLASIVIAGVLPGLWPALAAAHVNVSRALGSPGGAGSGTRPSRLRQGLVGAQVAGSTAFLCIAALLVQSYSVLALADMGFDRDHLLVADVDPSSGGYDVGRSRQYVDALLDGVRALPGVADAAVAARAPFFIGFQQGTAVWPQGGACEGQCPTVETMAVGPGYFGAMGIALVAGREFRRGPAAAEVVINQPLARQQWPDGGGLGGSLRIGEGGTLVTVVGITARTHARGLDREEPLIYVPMQPEHFDGSVSLVVRAVGDPAALAASVIGAARSIDPAVPVPAAKTMEQRMAVQLWPFRTVSWLFSICGSLALILATVGLCGIVIHAVNRRRREFGVRVAVGATPRDLMFNVLRGSTRLLVPGLIGGVLIAAAVARLIQVAIHGVNVLNPVTYLTVGAIECIVVALACLGPAFRAARVDPLTALRAE